MIRENDQIMEEFDLRIPTSTQINDQRKNRLRKNRFILLDHQFTAVKEEDRMELGIKMEISELEVRAQGSETLILWCLVQVKTRFASITILQLDLKWLLLWIQKLGKFFQKFWSNNK